MEKELWIYAHWNVYSKSTEYQLSNYERGEISGDVLIEKRTIEFESPDDKELRMQLAIHLKAKLYHMRGEHAKAEVEAQEVINELTSIEFKPESEQAKSEDDIPF